MVALDVVVCPSCGKPFDAADPTVRRLTPAAYHAYHRLRTALKNGQSIGVSRMAQIVGVQPPSMYPHIKQMVAADLAIRIPKRAGGRYFLYRLA